MNEKPQYYHITDPFWPCAPRWLYAIWRKVFCEHGIHLLDEVGSNDDEGYIVSEFVCDACDMRMEVSKIE